MSSFSDLYTLSPLQEGMLFHSLYSEGAGAYMIQYTVVLSGNLDIQQYERAWKRVIKRHTILQTGFLWEEAEKPLQIVFDDVSFSVHQLDWSQESEEDQQKKLKDFLEREKREGFDLTEPPLMRVTLIKKAEKKYQLIWSFHHLLLDGWSSPIVYNEVMAYYDALCQGRELRLPRPRPFREYISWLRQQDKQQAEKFWRQYLQGITGPTPLNFLLESRENLKGKGSREESLELSLELTKQINELSRKYKVTVNTVVQGAWAYLLSKVSGEESVVYGTTVSGRPSELPGVESMVGMFINTLPIKVEVNPKAKVTTWLQQLQDNQAQIRQYEYTPLVDIQGWSEIPPGATLVDSIYVFENYPFGDSNKESELVVSDVESFQEMDHPLTVVGIPGEKLTLKAVYDQGRFDAFSMKRALQQMAFILETMVQNPEGCLNELSLMGDREHHQLLVEWNQTQVPVATDRLVPERIAEIAAQMPEQQAIVGVDQSISYGELDRRANQVAHYLQKQGVGAETLVGVCTDRSVEMFIGMLGIMKAGAAYVPMDPAYPAERLSFMMQDAAMPVVLTQAHLLDKLSIEKQTCICLDRDWNKIAIENDQAPQGEIRSDQLAYVIYTSGSTGTPKGVEVEHRSLLNLISWHQRTYEVTVETRATQIAGTAFDASVWETWPYLTQGSTLYLPEETIRLEPEQLRDWLIASEITVSFLPTPLAESILSLEWPVDAPLRYLLTGGDKLHRYPAEGTPFTLVNHYGPTENTVVTTAAVVPVQGGQIGAPSIGRPIDNVQVYVLDGQMKPVPVGIPGELYIGGGSVARGYWNRPDLTAEQFVSNPFSETPGSRLYKTGDLVRYLPDGDIEFIGRIDNQISIRGFRVELGEIESLLNRHPAIQQSVVIPREDTPGIKRIAAYLVLAADLEIEVSELRLFIKEKLPDYMVPSSFVVMEQLPLTPNGKVDHKALPKPENDAFAEGKYVAPRTPTEEIIANVYAQVLSVKQVGIYDNFFELGGHSLLATQALSRLREAFDATIPLRILFENPTVEELSQEITSLLEEGSGIEGSPITLVDRDQPIPLSYAQQRLWFLDQLIPNSALYNIPITMRIEGELDIHAWEQSLQEIVARHESLRTTFAEMDGEGIQVIHPQLDWQLNVVNLQSLEEAQRKAEVQRLVEEDAELPFDLTQGPLIRATLIQVAPHRYVFVLNLHHIVADGWSMGVLMDELAVCYEAFRSGEMPALPELSVQYADYAAWQRQWLEEGNLEKQLRYWQEKLQDSEPLLPLPTDFPRPAEQRYEGALYTTTFSKELLEKLQALSREEGATLFMTLLSGFQAMLGRYTGKEDILVGTPVAGRNRREAEELIGFFVNTLVMRGDLSGEPTFRELLGRIRETALEAYAHQDVPFEKLVDELELERSLSYSPLFQVMFVLQNIPPIDRKLADLQVLPYESGSEEMLTKFDLTVTMMEAEEGLVATFEYNTHLFMPSTIERMVTHFHQLLEGIVEDPDQSVNSLPVLPKKEQDQLVKAWNQTAVPYPREKTVAELFMEIAAQYPEQTAVVMGESSLTYGELDRRTNQLAHYLRKAGIGPDTLVGICAERSLELITGLIGILKAGGAYVPLDPDYPEERLAYMMEDADVSLLLTQEHLIGKLPTGKRAVLCLDRDWEQIASEREEALEQQATANHLAYVIYTSGSTGTPKGVCTPHRGIVRLVTKPNYVTISEEDVFLQGSTVSFDAATFEIWGSLLNGAKLVMMPAHLPSLEEWREAIQEHGVTTLWLTAGLFTLLVDYQVEALKGVRQLLVGGDVVSLPHVRKAMAAIDGLQIINGYGPTETTTFACCYPVTSLPETLSSLPIGRPIQNTTVYVLDSQMQPVPIGVPGELYIGGDGLARGYLNNPELTEAHFVPDPFSQERGARLYKTGDQVRWLADGTIEFLGRIDHQVKVRGFRIELGEIETALHQHEAVKEALVMVREDSPGDKRLTAYLVVEGDEVEVVELRSHLKAKLPDYMMPAAFVLLESFPLTPNGKVDRQALPVPEYSQGGEEGYVAPQSTIEVTLAEIWQEVLGIEEVGTHDNFFERGGDSILSIQIVARAREKGLHLSPKQLFENQTIAELAQVVGQVEAVQAEQGLVTGTFPLSPIQRWFVEQEQPSPHHWNQSMMLTVNQDINLSLLEQAIGELVIHHDALRLHLVQREGVWKQEYGEPTSSIPFQKEDLSSLPEREKTERMEEIAQKVQESFNLTEGLLMKAVYFHLGNEREGRLLFVMHHLIVDGVSWRILLEDLQKAYLQLAQGEKVQLPLKTTSFKEWVHQLGKYANSVAMEQEKDYWLNQVHDITPLPTDHICETNQESATQQITFSLTEKATQALLQESLSSYRLQVNDVLLAALAKAVSTWTGSDTVAVHLEGHGREEIVKEVDLSRTVGWFTSMYPVFLQLEQQASWGEALKSIKEQLRQIPNQGIGYGILRYLSEDAETVEQLRQLSKPEISFNYLGQFDQVMASSELFGMASEPRGSHLSNDATREHLIDITGAVTDGQLHLTWMYNETIHNRDTIEAVARAYMAALQEIIDHCASEEAFGYTPSDFPLATLGQKDLDRHLSLDPSIEDVLTLSPLQHGMLFHSLYAEEGGDYVVQLNLTFSEDLNLAAFAQAWQQVVDHHAILRTSFIWEGLAEPHQVVRKQVPIAIDHRDIRGLTTAEQEDTIAAYLEKDRVQNFDLVKPPLMRWTVFHLQDKGQQAYRIVWSFHHALLDGWSMPLVFKDWLTVYTELVQGKTAQLESRLPFRDYIAWLKRQDLQEAEQFWREQLQGFDTPTPLGMGKVGTTSQEEKRYESCSLSLPVELSRQLQDFVRQNKMTLNTLVLGAWSLILSRYSSEEEVLFGATGSGRPADLPGVESMVGLFINTLPVRVSTNTQKSVREWLYTLQQTQINTRQYEYTPLVDIHSWSELSPDAPFFESILVFENYPIDESVKEADTPVTISEVVAMEQTNYPLTVVAAPGKQLLLKILYEANRFSAKEIERLLKQMNLLLRSMVEEPESQLSSLSLMDEEERHQLLVEWNQTGIPVATDQLVPERVAAIAANMPEQQAIVSEDHSITYGELDRRANQVAHYLLKQGVGPETLVGLCTDRSVEMFIGMLGVMKAGAAYVPMDPAYPSERLAFMMQDGAMPVVLTQAHLLDKLSTEKHTCICLDRDWEQIAGEREEAPQVEIRPSQLAYVIYTSGSTGTPKGVEVEHRSLLNLISWHQRTYEVTAATRATQIAGTAFDASVWETWPYLTQGATLYLPEEEVRLAPEKLRDWLLASEITISFLPTPLAESILTLEWPAGTPLRYLLTGGDQLHHYPAKEIPFTLVNHYGPTENTVVTTAGVVPVAAGQGETPSIGKPIDNVQVYVLDGQMKPVPVGVPGELYIGGNSMARGYWNRPDLTADHFVPHPFSEEPGARLYKTGDLVRYSLEGELQFLGRIDQQVKIRGFRIELGEIEAALYAFSGVKEAVVVDREDSVGEKRLAAYVVLEQDQKVEVDRLREHLAARLPEYMVPAAFVTMESLPLTPNGKVDRKALPDPQYEAVGGKYVAPRTPTEEIVANVYAQVLSVNQVGVYDGFFDLGGHSLLATQAISRLQEAFDVSIPLRLLFESPAVEELSRRIADLLQEEAGAEMGPIVSIDRDQPISLSYAQQRLWFLDKLIPNSALYNIPITMRIEGELDLPAWEKSLQAIIARHESLRTTFAEVDGEGVQVIHSKLDWRLNIVDLQHLSEIQQEEEVQRFVDEDANQPFDLTEGPLMRASLIQVATDSYVFLLNLHHIVADGWSMGVLMDEMAACYEAFQSGKTPALPELSVQYADYSSWQRKWLEEGNLERQLRYWEEKLKESEPLLPLPTDFPRPAEQRYEGALYTTTFSKELLEKLQDLSREEGATLFMTLLSGFQAMLSCYTGKEDILVGTPVAGRNRREAEELIGFFVNTLVMRGDLSGEPTFRELLGRIRETALEAYAHQDVPFEKLVDELELERSLSYSPLFQVMFVLQNTPPVDRELGDLQVLPYENGSDEMLTKFDLTVTMAETEVGLAATFEYNTHLFMRSTIERMVTHFYHLLEGIVQDPDQSVNLLPLVPEKEHVQLVEKWNQTAVAYPREKTVAELFMETAAQYPERTAVVMGESSLTYGELDRRTNQLAHYLRKAGVGPDTLVGVCAERSLELITGLIGILKAGGTYVPLDPDYPEERIVYMMEDAEVSLLLTQAHLVEKLPAGERTVLCLDRDWKQIATEREEAPEQRATADHLAYVIYTSGSTGTPKGVCTPHRGIVRLVTKPNYVTISEEDVFLQGSTVSFDAATFEIWGSLLNGAKLVMMPPHLPSLEEWREAIQEHGVTTLWLTAGLFTLLVDHQVEALKGVRQLLVGGDVVSLPHVRKAMAAIDGLQIINGYGPTETTTFACCYPVTALPETLSSLPIGRPIQNTTVYVLDAQMQPVPIGVPGELYIGGDGLARGYLNNSELTEIHFVPDPFSKERGARLYKTGDQVRWLADGTIEFLGRMDDQVKVRGFRIELGEIETALHQHVGVKEALVMVREDSPGDKRLAAYLVVEGDEIEATALRSHLKTKLPDYMMPSAFVMLKSFPLTPNGKIDRQALPVPEYSQAGEEGYVAPETFIETTLAQIWKEVLGMDEVGIHDNFFALGGDSILSIQIVARASEKGLRLTPKQLFENQTIAELAQVVGQVEAVQAEQGLVTGTFSLTPIQKWFVEQEQVAPHHWNQSMLLKVNRSIDATVLKQAVSQLLAHHDALRLHLVQSEEGWEQQYGEWMEEVPFHVEDLSNLLEDEQTVQLEAIANQVQGSFDLMEGPLVKAVYFHLGDERDGRLLLVIHHLAVDGVSWRIILEDLQKAYQQLAQGNKVQLPLKTTSLKEWVHRLSTYADSTEMEQEKEYWLNREQDIPSLPIDRAYETNTEADTQQITFSLTTEETKALLQETLSAYRLQVNDVLLAALAKAVGNWTGSEKVVLHLEGHGREEVVEGVDLARTVGWFTSMYPVFLRLEQKTSWGEALKSVKEQLRQIPNQGIGYGILRYLSSDKETVDELRQLPKPEISFNYLGQFDQVMSSSDLFTMATEPRGSHFSSQAKREHLIDITGAVTDGQLHLTWLYNETIHDRSTIEAVAQDYLGALQEMIAHCSAKDTFGYTPSDFPLAKLGQKELDRYFAGDRSVEDVSTLSPLQHGMLFHSLYAAEGGDYVVQLGLTFSDDLDLKAYQEAWQQVVDHHAILRTSFIWEGLNEPHQVVRNPVKIAIDHRDLRGLATEEQEKAITTYLQEDRVRNFDLMQPPLMRWTVFRLEDQGARSYRIIWSFHHALLDGWSMPLVIKDWLTAYTALYQGKEVRLEASLPFSNYIAWLQRQDLQEAEAFWRQQLQGFDTPTPLGMGRMETASQEEKRYASCSLSLSAEVTKGLQAFVRQNKLTLNTLVLGAWALVLGRYSGEEEVLFGATGSGRPADLPGVESMVGLFINTLPLRVSLNPDLSLRDWLHTLQQTQIHTRQYEYTPLVDIHGWSEISPETPMFESILVFENYPIDESVTEGEAPVTISEVESVEQTNYPLTVVAAPGKELLLKVQYEENRFTADEVERLLSQIHRLLETMLAQPEMSLSHVSLLDEKERHQLLVEWNRTEATYPRELCLHQGFENQVKKNPKAVAIEYGDQHLTYAEVDQRANQVAHYLQKQGIGPDMLVGICVNRSPEMIIGLLGVMKAGAAYVPIDPAHPQERIAYMLQDTEAKVVLTQQELLSSLPEMAIDAVCLDGNLLDVESVEPVASSVTSRNLAYVIYTSGSTGQPKGVMVEHRSAMNLAHALIQEFAVDEASRVLQLTSFSFDVSVGEMMISLLSGATLLVEDSETLLPGPELLQFLQERRVTTIMTVPSVLSALPEGELPDLRSLTTGGEPCSRDLVARYGQGRRFFNCYGPTEATVVTTMAVCSDAEETPSIGRPLPNVKLYVLDKNMQPVPVGIPGELYIGGECLARGYWKQPAMTEATFIANPFGQKGERIYKTGDLVRYLPDGNLEFLDRLDEQVKIRGFRIELGEIEMALRQHPAVQEAVVIARDDQGGEKRLAAYLTAKGESTPDREELNQLLKRFLPAYMVPAGYVWLEKIPLTINGKVDRKALPDPDWIVRDGEGTYVAPRTPVEEIVANVYAQVLSIDQVGVYDRFFDLGGHSLLATQAISRLQEAFGVDIPLRLLFESPAVEELSQRISDLLHEESGSEVEQIAIVDRDQPLALSYAQQRLWFLDQLIPDSALYNIPTALRIEGVLDIPSWEKSLQAILQRHESLRTTFTEVDGQGVQVIHPELDWQLNVVDLQSLEEAQREAEVQRLVEEDTNKPFHLTEGPLMRATLIKVEQQSYVFLLNLHHIVSDGWSTGVLIDELMVCYEAFRRGEIPSLPELSVQYADYAAWQRKWLDGEVLEKQLSYWREKLQGSEPLLPLPTDRPRPAEQQYEGALHTTRLSGELLEQLQALSREEGSTLFMTLLAAFQGMLSRYTGKEDIPVGTPVAGRNRRETEELIGFFVNTLVLRGDLSGEPTFRELLARVRETALEAYTYQDLPFEKLVDELELERSLSYTPLFQVMFVLQNTPTSGREIADLHILPYENQGEEMQTKFDLTLTMAEDHEGLVAVFEYNKALFDVATIQRMDSHFHQLLEGIVQDPDRPVAQLPLLPKSEQDLLLEEWNETAVIYPREKTVAELFMETAAQDPERTAVVMGETSLTYGELDRRTNQLAHYLRKAGVGPDTLVGICAERSLELITGLIGILKAGGAYVPLDPDYPEERLAYMMADADVSLLLTQEHLVGKLPTGKRTVLCLDRDWEQIASEKEEALEQQATADHLAYVIYTSGSTGTPKGVCTPHRGIVRLVTKPNYVTISEEDVFLQGSTVSFDAATFEIWGSLLNGAKLVMMPPHLPSLEEWRAAIQEHNVTTLWLTAGLFTLLVDHQVEALEGVRQLLVGGDVVSLPHVRKAMAAIDGLQIINGYGPTETTTFACCYPVTSLPETMSSLPIGRPIQNTTVYVLDAQMRPVPIGVPGELYIGGDGLARGYLNNPELTEAHFVPNPFSQERGARLYKTGDQVRWLADGTIEFLGRIDHQVKVRGFRIELGEIETALHQHEAVKEALVMVREDSPGDKRLAAYLVVEGDKIEAAALRSHLKAKLPDYMMPAAFVLLESFPLTPNGKVDRRALPIPEYNQVGEEGYVAPVSIIETTLVDIWQEVLGVGQVGVHDNFFELGGDSIISIQIVARAKQAGIHLTPKLMFEHQTIAELAEVAGEAVNIHAEQGLLTGEVPLVPIQHWFFEKVLEDRHHWNQSVLLKGNVEPSIVKEAIRHVMEHHDVLRLRFVPEEGNWKQSFAEPTDQIPFTTVDLSGVPEEEQAKQIEEISNKTQRSLDLSNGPLLRAVHMNLGDAQGERLLIVIHHLVVDGVSWRILLEDLQQAYMQIKEGKQVRLPLKSTSYQYWAERLAEYAQSAALAEEAEYWMEQLSIEVPTLPKDFPTGLNKEKTTTSVTVSLSEEETQVLLQKMPSLYKTQINDVLATALAEAVHDWIGERTLLINMEGHGREDLFEEVDLTRTVGWFTSMYPVLLDTRGSSSPLDSLQKIKEQLQQIPNKGVGYGILRYLNKEMAAKLEAMPQAEISFNYMGQLDQSVSGETFLGFASESRGHSMGQGAERPHMLDLGCSVTGGQLHINASFSSAVYKQETMEDFVNRFRAVLLVMIEQAQTEEEVAASAAEDLAEFGWDADDIGELMDLMNKR